MQWAKLCIYEINAKKQMFFLEKQLCLKSILQFDKKISTFLFKKHYARYARCFT